MIEIAKIRLLAWMTIGYGLFYAINNYFTDWLYVVPGAHLIHLPSGIKILMVLVAGVLGASAIAIVALIYSGILMFPENWSLTFLMGLASFSAPLLSVALVQRVSPFGENLSKLRLGHLANLALSFAVINSSLHQAAIYLLGFSGDFINGFLVMFTGDITGTFIALYLLRFALKMRRVIKAPIHH